MNFYRSKVYYPSVYSFHQVLYSPLPPPHPNRVIDLIRHSVRLHYAVFTDKRISKQLFSFSLSPPRGCVSKRRTSLHGQISLFILLRCLQRTDYILQACTFHSNGQHCGCYSALFFPPPKKWNPKDHMNSVYVITRKKFEASQSFPSGAECGASCWNSTFKTTSCLKVMG